MPLTRFSSLSGGPKVKILDFKGKEIKWQNSRGKNKRNSQIKKKRVNKQRLFLDLKIKTFLENFTQINNQAKNEFKKMKKKK